MKKEIFALKVFRDSFEDPKQEEEVFFCFEDNDFVPDHNLLDEGYRDHLIKQYDPLLCEYLDSWHTLIFGCKDGLRDQIVTYARMIGKEKYQLRLVLRSELPSIQKKVFVIEKKKEPM